MKQHVRRVLADCVRWHCTDFVSERSTGGVERFDLARRMWDSHDSGAEIFFRCAHYYRYMQPSCSYPRAYLCCTVLTSPYVASILPRVAFRRRCIHACFGAFINPGSSVFCTRTSSRVDSTFCWHARPGQSSRDISPIKNPLLLRVCEIEFSVIWVHPVYALLSATPPQSASRLHVSRSLAYGSAE